MAASLSLTEGPHKNGKRVEIAVAEESSESETEPEPAKRFHRRISTNREIKSSVIYLYCMRPFGTYYDICFLACTKEGHLMKQTNFQSVIFDEIELTDLSVAECSTKNINHSFQVPDAIRLHRISHFPDIRLEARVITPFRNLVLCADSRREMEEWITALKTATNKEFYDWGLRYPDARYPDTSLSGRFLLGTEFLHNNLSHLSGIPLSGSGRYPDASPIRTIWPVDKSVRISEAPLYMYEAFIIHPPSQYLGNASQREMMSGQHNWYACSHARPTYCNVCREALSGVTSHGLSCEVCKFKAHKRCAVKAQSNCKWTTLAAIGREILEDEDGLISMPHQWLEGNLPVSAKCNVCDKTCGSVLKLQDWRCLWCKAMVHSNCKDQISSVCPLGQCKLSILPPTAINNIDSDGYWEATRPPRTSPLLVFVNTKSGDNQGVKFLRRFKQLLNPAQVFDLMNGGPHPGLRLFQKFDQFRILVCGGDGSVGWVLSEIDKLDLHKQLHAQYQVQIQ
uniref:diacylglycerol kinase (ATP) n=1 Tax=Magallana gigas TaxID=29159 RepID=K1QXV0_MAGGI